jgi:hypothetical protein
LQRLGPNYEDKKMGAAVHGEWETRLQLLFAGWKGKKKVQGMSLWSVEGLKYSRHAEKHGKRCTRIMRKSKWCMVSLKIG